MPSPLCYGLAREVHNKRGRHAVQFNLTKENTQQMSMASENENQWCEQVTEGGESTFEVHYKCKNQ